MRQYPAASEEVQASHGGEVLTGIALGTIGGLLGAFVMNRSHDLFDLARHRVKAPESDSLPASMYQDAGPRREESRETPATIKLADTLSRAATGGPVPAPARDLAGNIIHYAYSAATGAFYGGVAARRPWVGAGRGLPAGALLWVVADEIAVPVSGLARGPRHFPPGRHLQALINHLLFGLTVESICRLGRRRGGGP